MAYRISKSNDEVGRKLRTGHDEEVMSCPYDASHLFLKKRLTSHLTKCRRNYRAHMAYQNRPIPLVPCRFNPSHRVIQVEDHFHFDTCVDRYGDPSDPLGLKKVYIPQAPCLEVLPELPAVPEPVPAGEVGGSTEVSPENPDGKVKANEDWEEELRAKDKDKDKSLSDGAFVPRVPRGQQEDRPKVPPEYFTAADLTGSLDDDLDDEMQYFTMRQTITRGQAGSCGSSTNPPNPPNQPGTSFGYNAPPGPPVDEKVYFVSYSEVLDMEEGDEDEFFTPENVVGIDISTLSSTDPAEGVEDDPAEGVEDDPFFEIDPLYLDPFEEDETDPVYLDLDLDPPEEDEIDPSLYLELEPPEEDEN